MNLNERDWAEFRVGDLFRLEPTKGIVSDDLIEGFDVPYIAAKHDDNGMAMYCSKDGFEDWISKGNCIIFINLGAGSAGYANYIKEDFIGMSGKTTCGYNDNLNEYNGTFIATILCQERPKYSFGRSWTGNRLKDTIIKLPVDSNGNPNWQFMEDYIKSLHYKPLTTKNKSGQAPALNVQDWGEFCLGKLFNISKAYAYNQETFEPIEDMTVNKIGCITRTANNNGLDYYGELTSDLKIETGNALTIGGEGVVCFYQPEQFVCGTNMTVLRHKDLNKYNGLFISRVIDYYSKDRFSYGRAFNKGQVEKSIIKLPVDVNGNPDWQFMEQYIKALPYGDRLEG